MSDGFMLSGVHASATFRLERVEPEALEQLLDEIVDALGEAGVPNPAVGSTLTSGRFEIEASVVLPEMVDPSDPQAVAEVMESVAELVATIQRHVNDVAESTGLAPDWIGFAGRRVEELAAV